MSSERVYAESLKKFTVKRGHVRNGHGFRFGSKSYDLKTQLDSVPPTIKGGLLTTQVRHGLKDHIGRDVVRSEVKGYGPKFKAQLKLGKTYLFSFEFKLTEPEFMRKANGVWYIASQWYGPGYPAPKKWSNPPVQLILYKGKWNVSLTHGDSTKPKKERHVGRVPIDKKEWQEFDILYCASRTDGLVQAWYQGKPMGKKLTGETCVTNVKTGPIWKYGCYCRGKEKLPKTGAGFQYRRIYAGLVS